MTTTTLAAPTGTAVWKLDPQHSQVEFAVRHLMISKVKGTFTDVEGTLSIEGEDLSTARLAVEIGAGSIDTRVEQRDEHLRSADFFDVERFPALTFESKRVEPVGRNRFTVTGDLTIRDVTREVVLDITESGRVADPWGGERAGFRARGELDRKEFGLTWNQALETGGVLVGDAVQIDIEAEFLLQADD